MNTGDGEDFIIPLDQEIDMIYAFDIMTNFLFTGQEIMDRSNLHLNLNLILKI